MSDDRDVRKKPEDLDTSYYKMLQDLHKVEEKVREKELDAYELRHKIQDHLAEVKAKREAEEQAARDAPADEQPASAPPIDDDPGAFAREYLMRRQKEKGESPFQNLQ